MADDKGPTLVDLGTYRDRTEIPSEELASVLEHAAKMAREGKLEEVILSYHFANGTEYQEGGNMMWRRDGHLPTIHSSCHVLAAQALDQLLGLEE